MIRTVCICALLSLSTSPLFGQVPTASGTLDQQKMAAKALLERALTYARSVEDDEDRSLAIMNLAPLQVEAGDMEGASSSLQLLTRDENHDLALAGVAIAQAQAGHFDEALKAIHLIKDDERDKSFALHRIAVARAEQGSLEQAIHIASEIDSDYREKAEALRDIAASQLKAGNFSSAESVFQSAVATAQAGEDGETAESASWLHTEIVADIAVTRGRAGDIEGAERNLNDLLPVATQIQDVNLRADALVHLASAQVKVGDVLGAQETISRVPDDPNLGPTDGDTSRPSVILQIVEAQANLNQIGVASTTAATITEPDFRIPALCEIALAQARLGDKAGARDSLASATRGIPSDDQERMTAGTLDKIAGTYAKIGDSAMAERFFGEAVEAARSVHADWIRGLELEGVGMTRLHLNDFSGAIEMAREIPTVNGRINLFRSIAKQMVRLGYSARASQMLEEETVPLVKTYILMGMVDGLLPSAW